MFRVLKTSSSECQWLEAKLPKVSSGQELEEFGFLDGECGVYFTNDSPAAVLRSGIYFSEWREMTSN